MGEVAAPGPGLFAEVDRALVMAALADKLRGAGITVPVSATERATDAAGVVGAMTVDDLYWVTRLSFVDDHRDLPTFDRVFDAVFDTDHLGRNRGRNRRPPSAVTDSEPRPGDRHLPVRATAEGETITGGLPWATLPSIADEDDDDAGSTEERTVELALRMPSPDSAEAHKAFDLLDEDELARIGGLIEASLATWPHRRSRRRSRRPTGDRVSLRAGLRQALRTGGEPIKLPATSPVTRPRPVAMLLDVSGSMESFARAYLHVARPLAAAGRAEVFAFATDVTRITAALRLRSAAEAVAQASDEVVDRFGGTRLASSVDTVMRHRVWGQFLRGAVVVVVSDGWDTDSPDQLDRAMVRLSRLSHQVVWVNPRLAADDYQPSVAGMAAALPHCDRFLPGHSLVAMIEVLQSLDSERG
jgi:uncharacterized protein with von Willebrand factor type A (vWA) domain